jgi:hypothetical protein
MMELDQEYITSMIAEFAIHKFIVYKITKNFNPTTAFRESRFKVEKADGYFKFSDMFDTDKMKSLTTELTDSFKHVFKVMKNAHGITMTKLLQKDRYEKNMLVDLAKKWLLPVFKKVTFETGYKDYVKGTAGLVAENTGLGSKNTFHGMPDMLLNGVYILASEEHLSADAEDEDDASGCSSLTSSPAPGTSSEGLMMYVEGKKAIASAGKHQLFSIAVTSSFTNYNNCPSSNPMSPTVLLNTTKFQVCLFDCKHDLLLLSEPYPLVTTGRSKTLNPSATLLLWMVVNHRYMCGGMFLCVANRGNVQLFLGVKCGDPDSLKLCFTHFS